MKHFINKENFQLYPGLLAVWLLVVCGGILSCNDPSVKTSGTIPVETRQTFFQLLDSNSTGVYFVNQVKDMPDFNVLTYRNFYNGGGVALGDINNDGLADIYFTANLTSNRLYLNKGDFKFEDITEKAKVGGTRGWSTGVTMADVNADGYLDIYVSNSGDLKGDNKANELFINNGDLTFTEMAATYRLDNQGYSTQAAFFDYDLDGDLDCYLLNNSFKDPSKIELYKSMRDIPDALGGDKLYRNDGAYFQDVTIQAGIYSSTIGFGLGAVIGDINHDMYPDIYVSNDFWERDYLYINQGDGTFTEQLNDRLSYCSISSMGGDIADINNDGHLDILTTDMLAANNYRLKAMSTFDPYHLEDLKYRANYHYQIAQNCLQMNDGSGFFKETAMLAGISATDWSWGALFFDFQNDGRKDLFVSNGLQKDLMYMDFRDFLSEQQVHLKMASNKPVDFTSIIEQMPSQPLANYAFENINGTQFSRQSESLGLATPSFSNGAAYADLDNDGDLDLVVNNVNMPAFIYRNEAEKTGNHFLKIIFEGPPGNSFGIGAQVTLTCGDDLFTWQNFNTRGFQSSVEPTLLFGVGRHLSIDKLEVIWPDKKSQILKNIPVDQVLNLKHREAGTTSSKPDFNTTSVLYKEVSKALIAGRSKHVENRYNDFDHEILLHKMISTEGPRILKADVNNDHLQDFLLMGAQGDEDKLFLQMPGGSFRRKVQNSFEATKIFESTCGVFFDHDQDGDQDLILAGGGNEYMMGTEFFVLRYYANDGKGNFTLDQSSIPQVVGNFGAVVASDIDQDGDMDLFLGGRVIPGNYGMPPRSYLFYNEEGTWVDHTSDQLAGVGMITDALWVDIDHDKDQDLIVVGEWADIQIFYNEGGLLTRHLTVSDSKGWWTRIKAADIDQDGNMDFVIGNWGLNSKFQASTTRPLTMFVNDFDRNGKTEFIINWFAPDDNQAYPFATKAEITKQLPSLKKQILKYEDYAGQTYETLFEQPVRDQSVMYSATVLSTAILWNDGAGGLNLVPLPLEAQISPVYGIAVFDFTGDGLNDIWLGGNFYALKPQVGRLDSSHGILLQGSTNRTFQEVSPLESGILVKGEVRDADILEAGDQQILIITRNNEDILVYKHPEKQIK